MKMQELKKRLVKDRPTTDVNLKIPNDVIEDLKKISPQLGFSNYEALMRAYIGQGLREDLRRLENLEITNFIESLKRNGVDDEAISNALTDLQSIA